ncbi:MAG TPA: hypothetical protein VD769_05195 [Gaiellaceae bacterium]|nr:hypothetical protein [Gaiellaceae bacterium]
MRRRGLIRVTFTAAFVAGLLATGLGGAGIAAADGSPCPPSGGELCVTVTHTPAEVSASSADGPTFVAFEATVRNAGSGKLTQVAVTACLVAGSDGGTCADAPPGASFHSADSSAGPCTIAGATARCELGFLKRGTEATIELVARAPAAAGTFRNLVSASAKQQGPVTVSEPVTVLASGGPTATSFVPEGTAMQLLAADEGQTGLSKIPADHDALTAEMAITDDPPFVCPKREICRGGGWVSATIPGTFDALQFVLHWPDELVSKKQKVKNFVLFYIACDTCELEIIRDRCKSATPSAAERPCLWDIRDLKRDGFEATLISSHNGKMH